MKNGGGVVIVHASDNAFGSWDAFNEMIGVGGWRGRDEKTGPHWIYKDGKLAADTTPGSAGQHGNRVPYQVTVRDPEHPIVKGLPKIWMHQGDELYANLKGPGKNMTVLATAYSDPANKGTGMDEPQLIVLSYGKGRIFHTTFGHDVFALSSVDGIVTYQRGAEWAATGKVTQKIPASFPTADSVSYRADIAAMDPHYPNGLNSLTSGPAPGVGSAQGAGGGRGASGARGASGTPIPVPMAGGRFRIYPQEAVDRGLKSYTTSCLSCHGERAKGGKTGPDLITSEVSLHDEEGIGMAGYLKGAVHQKAAKLDLPQATVYDIASYIHSRVIVAAINRGGDVHQDDILHAGDPAAGKAYFNGAGGCAKCHTTEGNLKGVGAKYDAATLQDKIVMPRSGRGAGGRGRGNAPDPMAITATVTLPDGKTVKGIPIRVTDFDVTLRLEDESTQTWARNNGIPKVELTDPLAGHFEIMKKLTDSEMHNLTAYLATLK